MSFFLNLPVSHFNMVQFLKYFFSFCKLQRLFTTATEPYQKMVDQLWHIPLSYAVVDSSGPWTSAPQAWLRTRLTVINVNITATQAFYVNVGAIGEDTKHQEL